MGRSIFEKSAQLKPGALAIVAERRFGDAEALADTKENVRANGVAYLSGFVIEILLKMQLLKKFPHIARKQPEKLTEDERHIWRLIWRQHDLEAMLKQLPHVETSLERRGRYEGKNYVKELKTVCQNWTIHARYSPRMMLMRDAQQWLERVRVLKEMLK